jgi:dTDP-4-amino-4,6-dideoxygalactose transaminase
MTQPKVPLFGIFNSAAMEAAAVGVLRSGEIAGGKYVSMFEQGFGQLVNQDHVVSMSDFTSAIYMALHLSGVGCGDEVITSPFACMATNSAIALKGAVPVWCDLDRFSVDLNLADLESKISKKTKAVIMYHAAGYPGPAAAAANICRQYGISLIEDCNNALLATRNGNQVGRDGDFAVFSFYPNRQINSVEAGAIATKDPVLAERARRLRRFGIDPKTFRREDGEINSLSDIPEIGGAMSMTNFSGALGCAQLPSVVNHVEKARLNVQKLLQPMQRLSNIQPVKVLFDSNPAYWVFLTMVQNQDRALRSVKELGIQASTLHQNNNIYSGFKAAPKKNRCKNAQEFQQHVLAFPCGWWLSDNDIERISDAIKKIDTL